MPSDAATADKIKGYLDEETARIERGPIHMRAIRADTMRADWEKKEKMLLAWANDPGERKHPFGGQINAFDAARCINHFAGLGAKYRDALT